MNITLPKYDALPDPMFQVVCGTETLLLRVFGTMTWKVASKQDEIAACRNYITRTRIECKSEKTSDMGYV